MKLKRDNRISDLVYTIVSLKKIKILEPVVSERCYFDGHDFNQKYIALGFHWILLN